MRNYRQIAKSSSGTMFMGIGKSQGGEGILQNPRLYVNQAPRPPRESPIVRHMSMPFGTVATIEKEPIPEEV